jgi:hypothetical protein
MKRWSWLRALRVLAAAAACVALAGHPLGASQQADPPHVLEQAAPVLPDSLAALRLGGWVMVQVHIDTAGRVGDARPTDERASGYFFGPHARAFEAVAVMAARAYRFGPGAEQRSPAGVFALRIPFRVPPDSLAPPVGILMGRVVDGKGRTSGHVGICAPRAPAATLTLSTGEYRLEIPAGTHEIMISAEGCCPVRRTVAIRSGVTDTLDLALRACPGAALERCVEPARKGSR